MNNTTKLNELKARLAKFTTGSEPTTTEVIQSLKERLAQPDGREVALELIEQLDLPASTLKGLKAVSTQVLIELLIANMEAISADTIQSAAAEVADDVPNAPFRAGLYEHKAVLYLFLGLARDHETGEERVAYIPLASNSEWAGTARIALRPPGNFREHFRWVGERHP